MLHQRRWTQKPGSGNVGFDPTKLAVKDGESTRNDDGMGIPWGKPMEP